MRLTYEEAGISEELARSGGQSSADIFVSLKGGYNKIVALLNRPRNLK